MEHIIWSTGHQLKYKSIVSSDNCFLYDSEGNQMIDLESGVWCTSVGHNNKRINNVISSQINKITHTGFCYCNPQVEEAAKKVLEITGLNNGKCEFLCSGSEAVEYGMQAARAIIEKPLALAFADSYFGAYGDAAFKSDDRWFIYDRLNCSCTQDGNGCTGDCDDFNRIPFGKIGIFLFEPGSSLGLVRFPRQALITKIVSRIKDGNGIVMANEITTGIGRTGKWFGFQHYGIQPDIVAIGKGIGNGYPVSVTAVSQQIAELLEKHEFHYSQSHQNDPLGAVVASEVIAIITENELVNKAFEKGSYLLDALLAIKKGNPIIKEVRGRGLMLAIEFTENAAFIYDQLLKHGFIVAKRPNAEVLRLDPALTIDNSTIDLFIDKLTQILAKTEV